MDRPFFFTWNWKVDLLLIVQLNVLPSEVRKVCIWSVFWTLLNRTVHLFYHSLLIQYNTWENETVWVQHNHCHWHVASSPHLKYCNYKLNTSSKAIFEDRSESEKCVCAICVCSFLKYFYFLSIFIFNLPKTFRVRKFLQYEITLAGLHFSDVVVTVKIRVIEAAFNP